MIKNILRFRYERGLYYIYIILRDWGIVSLFSQNTYKLTNKSIWLIITPITVFFTGSYYYVAIAVLELVVYTRLSINSYKSICLCLPSAESKGLFLFLSVCYLYSYYF